MGQTRISLENQSRDGAVEADGALTVKIFPFEYSISGAAGSYAGATAQTVTDAATNYVFLNESAALIINTTGFPSGVPYIQLATVVAAAGAITAVNQKRIFLNAAGPIEPYIDNETPTQTSSPNGLIFTTAFNFATGTTNLYLNGVKQKLGVAYTETAANQVTFAALTNIDTTFDEVTINYLRT